MFMERVGVSCRIAYSPVVILYVSGSGSITLALVPDRDHLMHLMH